MQELLVEMSRTLAARSERLVELQSQIAELQQEAGRPARAAIAGLLLDDLYMHGPVTVRFDPEGSFQMANIETGEALAGTYSLADGFITLSQVDGELHEARFPMRCGITAEGAGFMLEDKDGSCADLAGVSFNRVGP